MTSYKSLSERKTSYKKSEPFIFCFFFVLFFFFEKYICKREKRKKRVFIPFDCINLHDNNLLISRSIVDIIVKFLLLFSFNKKFNNGTT